jgi:hypothetical protein
MFFVWQVAAVNTLLGLDLLEFVRCDIVTVFVDDFDAFNVLAE